MTWTVRGGLVSLHTATKMPHPHATGTTPGHRYRLIYGLLPLDVRPHQNVVLLELGRDACDAHCGTQDSRDY